MLFPIISRRTALCVLLCCLATQTSAYFEINEPHKSTQWSNGAANLATWRKGVNDGVNSFDIELARLGKDGLTFVARNVPTTFKSINIFLDGIPAGDDYFLIFLNSTHGVMHATSPRFSILPAGGASSSSSSSSLPPSSSPSSASSPPPKPDPNAPTVTVSGAPNPTQAFATTFPASPNGAVGALLGVNSKQVGWSLVWCVMVALLSGVWTVW